MIILGFLNNKNLFRFIFGLNLIIFTYTVGYYPYRVVVEYVFETFGTISIIYPVSSIILSYIGIGLFAYFVSKIILKRFSNKSKYIILLCSVVILAAYWFIIPSFFSIQQI